jgi:hypothetical protein
MSRPRELELRRPSGAGTPEKVTSRAPCPSRQASGGREMSSAFQERLSREPHPDLGTYGMVMSQYRSNCNIYNQQRALVR